MIALLLIWVSRAFDFDTSVVPVIVIQKENESYPINLFNQFDGLNNSTFSILNKSSELNLQLT